MSDLNRATIIGRLGQDPEIRALDSGEMVATMSVATGDKWKDKTTGDLKEKTEWHRVTAFGAVVKSVIQPYLKKGSQVYIEGALRTRKWQDKQGQDRWTTEIVLQNIQLLGKPGGGGREGPPPGDPPRRAAAADVDPYAQYSTPSGGAAATPAGRAQQNFDEEIPF